MTEELFITTIDNPFNPATESHLWEQFDRDHGYNSYAYACRFLFTSDELSKSEQIEAFNNAVRDAVDNDFTNRFIAVTKDTKIHPISVEEADKLIN